MQQKNSWSEFGPPNNSGLSKPSNLMASRPGSNGKKVGAGMWEVLGPNPIRVKEKKKVTYQKIE